MLGGPPLLPEAQVEQRHLGLETHRAPVVGADDGREARHRHAELGIQVVFVALANGLGRHGGHECSGRGPAIIPALGDGQQGLMHPGILTQGRPDRLRERELDGSRWAACGRGRGRLAPGHRRCQQGEADPGDPAGNAGSAWCPGGEAEHEILHPS